MHKQNCDTSGFFSVRVKILFHLSYINSHIEVELGQRGLNIISYKSKNQPCYEIFYLNHSRVEIGAHSSRALKS